MGETAIILAAVIGCAGVVCAALIGLGNPILSALLLTPPAFLSGGVHAPTPTSPIIMPTPTANPIATLENTAAPTGLLPSPSPTSWPVANAITQTDSTPLCTITWASAPQPDRPDAVAITFNILTITSDDGSTRSGWCSWSIPLNGYDATEMAAITFWVRGQKGGERFDVGLLDRVTQPGDEPKVLQTAGDTWRLVSIHLTEFQEQNLASLRTLSVGFNTPGVGTVYVAGIAFAP